METGKVKWWNDAKGYGFIVANDGHEIFVHYSEIQMSGFKNLREGQSVAFERLQNTKGEYASSVQVASLSQLSKGLTDIPPTVSNHISTIDNLVILQPVSIDIKSNITDSDIESEDIEDLITDNVEQSLLMEISKWKREAKAEDNSRYFWHMSEVEKIRKGDKYFIIGRKGTGKTAICEYFNRLKDPDIFAEKLSFKSFPFNELYMQKNQKYTPPSQYISIWKYLIYNTVCRLMLKNEAIDINVKEQLNELYNDNISLQRRLQKWTSSEFGISLFGMSIKFSKNKQLPSAVPLNWIEQVDYLEDLVSKYAGSATYYILFDELDEDYREIVKNEQNQQYVSLITSLFKAAQDVITTLGASGQTHIYPIVFLRDDIYEIVQDADKNKWGDFKIDLNWDDDKIQRLIAFRISRALDANCKEPFPFIKAWSMLFGKQPIGIGSSKRKKISTFEFIVRSTLLRPRDFVNYLQECAQHAVNENIKITPKIVKHVDKNFSNYLKDEFIDELFAVLPDISNIFSTISQLRKWNFSIKEIEHAYNEQVNLGYINTQNAKAVLQTLFLFSVIGNSPHVGRYIFRYKNKAARLNFNERIVVHRGLFKALQIL